MTGESPLIEAVDAPGERAMTVMLVVYCLRGGGAERVASYIANHLANEGHAVAVVTELAPETDQYPLAERIDRITIGDGQGGGRLRKSWRMARKVWRLRRAIRQRQPDVVLSLMTRSNNLTLLATTGSRVAVAIAERNDPRHNNERAGDARLRRWLYPRADLVVAQTDTMAVVMRDQFGVARTAVVPNPALTAMAAEETDMVEVAGPYILAMGRLAPQKGFDVLIRAYARSDARRSVALVLAGQGGRREELEALTSTLGIADRVHLVGHVERPFPLIRGCRMFVLSSRYEGFPNVLLEAMSLGRPVISTRLPSGAHAMIEDGVSGLLVPVGDVDALAAAIDRLASDPDAAEAMGARGPAAVAPFALPVVMDRWERVLTDVANGSRR